LILKERESIYGYVISGGGKGEDGEGQRSGRPEIR